MINFELIKDILHCNKKFILTTHINPDGDALGSELAMAYLLKKLDKDVRIINFSQTPHYLNFLDTDSIIEIFDESKINDILTTDVLIALDFNNPDRIKGMKNSFINSKAFKICIDHHRNPGNFVNELFCDIDYCATGEIVYDIIKVVDETYFDLKIANNIYTAIMTDTGSFRFQRMKPKIHIISAHMLELGVNPTEIYNCIYNELTREKLLLLGKAIAGMKYTLNGDISYIIVDQEMLKEASATEEDIEGFVNHTLSVKNTEIGLLFLELKDGVKVSLRSRKDFPVNALAEFFNGGGHLNAAGIRFFHTTIDETVALVLNKSELLLKEYYDKN